MRYRPLAVILTALALTSGLAALASATKQAPSQAKGIGAALAQVRETRRLDIAPLDEDAFVFPHEKAGLFLTFTLDVPAGLTLVELDQPQSIRATDSAGADLAVIQESFMGRREHIELEQNFGEAPTGFTLTLAAPARTAARFNVEAQMTATLFAAITETTMPAPSDWTPLPADVTGGRDVRIRVDGDAQSVNVHVQPGTAKELLEDVVLRGARGELDSMGSMWSDAEATFYFTGAFEKSMTVMLKVRTGLTTAPVTVSLAGAPLP